MKQSVLRRIVKTHLGGIGLAVLALASGADAASTVGIVGGGVVRSPSPLPIIVLTPAQQMASYQASLLTQPQNTQTPHTHFVMDANGGNFQPAMVDLSRKGALTRGTYTATPPANQSQAVTPLPASTNAWSALEEQAHVNAIGVTETLAAPYVRNPAWISEGQTIDSCQKYVYDSFYDVERWIDALNACGDDATCKVTYSDTAPNLVAPTIARPVLADRAGSPINNRLGALYTQGLVGIGVSAAMDSPDIFTDYANKFSTYGSDQDSQLIGMAKNAFYAGTQNFIVPQLAAAFSAAQQTQLTALGTELASKQQYYFSGQFAGSTTGGNAIPNGVLIPGTTTRQPAQGFRDEWDFHQVMNTRTAGMSDGEATEYSKRQDAIATDLQAVAAIPWCQASQTLLVSTLGMAQTWLQCHPPQQSTTAPATDPYNGGDPDPFTAPAGLQGQVSAILGMSYIGAPVAIGIGGGLSGIGGGVQAESLTRKVATTPAAASQALSLQPAAASSSGGGIIIANPGIGLNLGVSGTASATNHSSVPVSFVQRAWQILPPILDTTQPDMALQCTPLINQNWIASLSSDDQWVMANVWGPVCETTNSLLQEWSRVQLGSPSCLDSSNYKCDWSPQMFVDRFVNMYWSQLAPAKEAEYEYCKRWTETTGGQFPAVANDPLVQNGANLTTFRSFLDSRKALYDKIMKNVPIRAKDNLGTEKLESASLGNSAFGGGYSYDLGWNAQITKRDPTTNDPCEWGGGMQASFNANATIMGITQEVVDALADVSATPTGTTGTGTGTMAAHLRLMGSDVFPPISKSFQFNGSAPSGSANQAQQYGNETKVTIVDGITIPAGPVQVVLSAGIEYGWSADVTYGASVASGCSLVPNFSANVGVDPEANLGVWGTATATFAEIIGVGLDVQLTLLGIEVPLTATMNMTTGNDPFGYVTGTGTPVQDTFLNLDIGLDLKLHTLDGSVSVFGEVFGFKVFEVPLVTWKGPETTIPLFHTPAVAVPLPFLDSVDPTSVSGPTPG